jgi:hypothetical protein
MTFGPEARLGNDRAGAAGVRRDKVIEPLILALKSRISGAKGILVAQGEENDLPRLESLLHENDYGTESKLLTRSSRKDRCRRRSARRNR